MTDSPCHLFMSTMNVSSPKAGGLGARLPASPHFLCAKTHLELVQFVEEKRREDEDEEEKSGWRRRGGGYEKMRLQILHSPSSSYQDEIAQV